MVKMKKISTYLLLALGLMLGLGSCFKDLGNYDYTEINEAVIGDAGFGKPYDCRTGIDRLTIHPDITFTKDSEGQGDILLRMGGRRSEQPARGAVHIGTGKGSGL